MLPRPRMFSRFAQSTSLRLLAAIAVAMPALAGASNAERTASLAEVTNLTFRQEVIEDSMNRLVLLEFYADWCGPCKTIAPALAQMAETYRGRVDIRRVNVDTDSELSHRYHVRGIPRLLLIRNGVTVGTIAGAESGTQLKDWLDAYLKTP